MNIQRFCNCLAALILLATIACAETSSPTPRPHPSEPGTIVMRDLGENGHIWHGNDIFWLKAFDVGGKRVTTIDELKSAILALPDGSKLLWDSGCLDWGDGPLPLSGPSTSITALQKFCSDHGRTFLYRVSGY